MPTLQNKAAAGIPAAACFDFCLPFPLPPIPEDAEEEEE